MKWREGPTTPFVFNPPRAHGSLPVASGPVLSVYGPDLVEAWPATYVIVSVGVARVDNVVAGASEHKVVTFAGDDLVVALAALDRIVPAATVDLVTGGASPEAILEDGAHDVLDEGASYGVTPIRSGRTEFRSLTPQVNTYP